jgi:5-methylcytosine-specific restriction endonuclease McrA
MKDHNSKCLVLNADYSPLGIISWKRAMIWSVQYDHRSPMSIEIIDFYKDDFIAGANGKQYQIPAVVKTNRYFKFHHQTVNFSRKNLFIRDNYTCQYCHSQKEINNLTYDHVIPKSVWDRKHGSPTCWTNIVTACVACNRKKSNKTPQQANMNLKITPSAPNKSYKFLYINEYILHISNSALSIPKEWQIYVK